MNSPTAFPAPSNVDEGGTRLSSPGMSLRDWFAGQALNGMISRSGAYTLEELSERSYKVADMMLVERSLPASPQI